MVAPAPPVVAPTYRVMAGLEVVAAAHFDAVDRGARASPEFDVGCGAARQGLEYLVFVPPFGRCYVGVKTPGEGDLEPKARAHGSEAWAGGPGCLQGGDAVRLRVDRASCRGQSWRAAQRARWR